MIIINHSYVKEEKKVISHALFFTRVLVLILAMAQFYATAWSGKFLPLVLYVIMAVVCGCVWDKNHPVRNMLMINFSQTFVILMTFPLYQV